MSLEQHLEALTITVAALTAATQQLTQVMMNATVSLPSPTATATIAQALPAPVALAPAAPIAVAAGMPPAPFAAPGAAPAAMPAFMQHPASPPVATLPFSDVPSLIKYAGTVYMTLEQKAPGSGNRINEVLASVGLSNMNDATVAHYPNIYAGLESLKAA